ncbi:type II methionyl aminopeptidase [Candidatus Woesearchaeota archaeon]|nr:type II methionyl aminopeptidase [Candidatus Woesearchaeota archaeon]
MEQISYSEEEIEKWKQAGRASAQALEYGLSLVKKGASVLEVCDKVDAKIFELGAKPSFPSQVSLNDVAAHFCPEQEDKIILDAQLVKLDVGACVGGFLGDTAATVDLSGGNSGLVNASRAALDAAVKVVAPGVKLREIGSVIKGTISSYGFSPVVNLSGHGIGKFQVHAAPTIPNFDNGDDTELYDGQIIAIEPFATTGEGAIYESSNPSVFMMAADKPIRDAASRQVLAEIRNYEGLPFTTRWLTRKFPAFKVGFALRQLSSLGIIQQFPPLVEKRHGLVSQAEHTVLVMEKPAVLTSTWR